MTTVSLSISNTVQLGPRTVVEVGDTVKIKGRRGVFYFQRHVVSDRGKEWVDVFCKDAKSHSVRPSELKRASKRS